MVVLDSESGVTKNQTDWHTSKVVKRAQKRIVLLTTM